MKEEMRRNAGDNLWQSCLSLVERCREKTPDKWDFAWELGQLCKEYHGEQANQRAYEHNDRRTRRKTAVTEITSWFDHGLSEDEQAALDAILKSCQGEAEKEGRT